MLSRVAPCGMSCSSPRVQWVIRHLSRGSFLLICWLYNISDFLLMYHILFYFLTLQYWIGFAIYQHESATGIHVFPILNAPPSPYHPSGSSQCTSPKHPVSCIRPGLATHFIYDIIHVSMPFSQIILPSPSPRVQKTVLYISDSFAVSYTGLLLPYF